MNRVGNLFKQQALNHTVLSTNKRQKHYCSSKEPVPAMGLPAWMVHGSETPIWRRWSEAWSEDRDTKLCLKGLEAKYSRVKITTRK